MTVRANKPAFSIREKLKELQKPTGLKGSELMRSETVQEARDFVSAGRKNILHNGAMVVDQRNAGASISVSSGAGYAADRFNLYANTGTFALQRVSDAPTGFIYSDKVTVSSAGSSSSGAGNAVHFEQKIEGYNIDDLGAGTSNAKVVTLSFWVKSSVTGTYSLHFGNDTDRFYVTTYSITSANTWEYKTKTITLATSGTWNTTNGRGLEIVWSLLGGSTYQTSSIDQWISTEDFHATGSVQFGENASATWQITGVQLEVGKNATEFEHRSYGEELALCQRYFFNPLQNTSNSRSTYPISYAEASASTGWTVFQVPFPVAMRIPPTLSHNISDSNSVQGSPSSTQWAFYLQNQAYRGKQGGSNMSVLNVSSNTTQANVGAYYASPSGESSAILFGSELTFHFNAEL